MKRLVVLAALGMMAIMTVGSAVSAPAAPPAMQKQVTPQGGFVLYLPAGWKADEGCDGQFHYATLSAPRDWPAT